MRIRLSLSLFMLQLQHFSTKAFVNSRASCSSGRCLALRFASTAEPNLPPLEDDAKRIFWVRHGEVINPGGDRPVYYGAMDVPLSELGQLEAQAAGDYLQKYNLASVFCSPLSRAIYGANQVIEKQTDSDVGDAIIIPGFKEMDRGDWCGQTKDEIGADLMARFDACDLSVTPGNGGESYPALKDRVLEARDQALKKLESGQQGCVVSHLQVTRCVLSDAEGIPTDQMSQLPVATASVTCIDYYPDDRKTQLVHFSSYKPAVGLAAASDLAN